MEKKSADAVEEIVTPPEVASDPKAAHAWAELKGTNKALTAETAELTAKLEEATKNSGTVEEIAKLRGQLEQYETRLGQLDLAATSGFKSKFETPMSKLVARGIALLKKTGMEDGEAGRIVAGVFQAPTQDKVNELISDQDLSIQGALVMAASEYGELAGARKSALEDWKSSKAAVEEQTKRDQEVAFAQMAAKDLTEAIEQSRAEGNWMFKRTDGANPEWDTNVDNLESTVMGLVKTAEPKEIMKWITEGVTAKPLRELFAQEQARSAKLQSELDAALGANPKLGADGRPAPKAREPGKPMSADEYVNSMF